MDHLFLPFLNWPTSHAWPISVKDIIILTTLWYVNRCPFNPDNNHKKALNYFLWIMSVILLILMATKVIIRTWYLSETLTVWTDRTYVSENLTFNLISGELLASSTMGVNLFDLFGEIVSENDLIYFLRLVSAMDQS